jgi:hypothetical protein
MAKITVAPDPSISLQNPISVKVRKKSGEERTFVAKPEPPFRNDEIMAKFKKSAEFFKIKNADEILHTWMNLHDLDDIGKAVAVLKRFQGYNSRPLSDRSPSPNS